ncbi:ABC transporter ATP-binding protein [Bifidobacterium psychraerophilum]|jgi:peptide/nickel transport system ATP-binding protein|uniref:ABC transporter ATP-binding protein n=1 Tax=Bifidobacterium psychraerophilum TaxID=218140 RepID=UPI0023F157A0|nr:ABC transporter ATP-binding protein [Bifidobacterium psychraerophilum]MCI1659756.1 ABC transporter ATP-binding protein [Bifidobacterium psychraerophilum]MCI1804687.1 ABC transporter ATP-binding protein [Bifidobacterium psychraerophilum]MCI2176887.1 ABC transporter ATP-binding protein [Bifidobacterium psychraerophilum]MCI2182156.1 ABC transporter ATP-binding protein [Bifidobacterium psychraerophilum]
MTGIAEATRIGGSVDVHKGTGEDMPDGRQDSGAMSAMLEVRDLVVSFQGAKKSWNNAVEGVDFSVRQGEILGIVGESGCGKSVTSFSIMRLHNERSTKYQGSITFDGSDIFSLSPKQLRELRGGDIGFIFQNPMSSLNPLMTIGQQLRETVHAHQPSLGKEEVEASCIEALEDAGSDDPKAWMERYPYQLSGGMLQRVVIGIALINHPKLLIADEPTTALDVTIQMQLLKVLRGLRDKRGMSIILITHDMGVVAQMCDRVEVMYLGQIVESAPVDELFAHPRHPYTQGLLAATPPLDGDRPERLSTIPGSVPQLSEVAGNGCRFASRCPFVADECRKSVIDMQFIAERHGARCIRLAEIGEFRKVAS